MIAALPNRAEKWRQGLTPGDEIQLLNWVRQSGLERVARIVSTLTKPFGEHGQPLKLHSLLLRKMAHLKNERPHRKLHSIAKEVAREAPPQQPSPPVIESLVSKLERDFRRWRHTWMMLSVASNEPSSMDIANDAKRSKPRAEYRALARIVELLPGAMDGYEAVLADAKAQGPEKAILVRRIGRGKIEPLLANALKKQSTSLFVLDANGVSKIPRSLFDLIEWDLQQFFARPPVRQSVGRKGVL